MLASTPTPRYHAPMITATTTTTTPTHHPT